MTSLSPIYLRLLRLLLLASVPLCSGCLAFGLFQSARLVEPGKPRDTVSLVRNDFKVDDQTAPGWTGLELQRRYGIRRTGGDAGLRLSLLRSDDGDIGMLAGVDLRNSLWRDHLVLRIPITVLAGDYSFSTLQVHPTLIATLPLTSQVELNAGAQVFLLFASDEQLVYALNFGPGLSPDWSRWVLRPELALLYRSMANETFYQFGVGIEFPAPGNNQD